ncbi:hypothetical protein [Pontiella agarivorans]|uniref:Uncharacterized protein n=1 Tax=Pontiella agarivorans TaxID=3038953 RepID=A0ABU5MZX9_9BACT|nr:hypothetical protein [Pontiella agarivorans]MDZ8119769.1 hypothetical protein [Pontiella agarivorans]
MKKTGIVFVLLLIGFVCRSAAAVDRFASASLVPTHADAAIVFGKYFGLFDQYIDENASLTDCVKFFNKHGVYFGLMEVVNGSEFTFRDCARVMGQIELLLSGEAEYFMGKVKLPIGIASWEEFCIMNRVDYTEGHAAMLDTLKMLSRLKR